MALFRVIWNCPKNIRSCKIPRHWLRSGCLSAENNGSRVFQRQCLSTRQKPLPFEVDTANIGKDILVFSYQNQRFYKLLNLFGIAQFGFWAYLALFSIQTLRDAPEEPVPSDASWWRRIAAKESKYKNGISILCVSLGYIMLCISIMYPTRAVHKLWLLKGGDSVRLETYSAIARYRSLTVPVQGVSCLQSRADCTTQIPMKVKGRWFFYLLDSRGVFHETQLFDLAIGLRRTKQ